MNQLKEICREKPYLIGGTLASLAFFYALRKLYFAGGRCRSKARLDGKTAIVTGANCGLGKETALEFAKRGARVILACRDPIRANKAAEEIRQISGNQNVIVEIVDLSSFESIREFVKRICSNEKRVDILVNNAAVMGPRWLSKDGNEMQLQVNHLAPFLMTNLLLDKLKQSGSSRIVNVNSLAYEHGCKEGSLDLDDLQLEKSYEPMKSYKRSKILNVLYTRSLAKRLQGSKVTVNALHPGVIMTEISRNFSEAYNLPKLVYILFMFLTLPIRLIAFKSINEGAQTQIYCSISEDLEGVSGLYFSDCKPKAYMPLVLDDSLAEKVWKISEELTNKKV